MALEITGKVIALLPETNGVSKAGNAWRKREFILETQEQYPKKVAITVMNDKVDDLSHYVVGNTITASLNLESREYEGRWFSNINAWKLSGSTANATPPPAPPIEEGQIPDSTDVPF